MYNDKEKVRKSKSSKKKQRRFFFLPLKDNERVLSASEKKYFKILNGNLIINCLLIVLGVLLCFLAFKANIWLGLIFILYGIVKVLAFLLKDDISLFDFNILYAIGSIIIGIITMFSSVNVMLGVWFILICAEDLELMFRLKRVEEKSWNFSLMVSVMVLFMGILLMVNPFVNLSFYQVVGVFLILYGVLSSTLCFLLKSRSYSFI